jgi:hypothetical protein
LIKNLKQILADVAHRTTENERTKAISIILGCRQLGKKIITVIEINIFLDLGLLIGPCFTLIVRLMDFHIG